MSLLLSHLTHTESAEHQIFLTFEKYCVPCKNKDHESVFFMPRKKEGGESVIRRRKKKEKKKD